MLKIAEYNKITGKKINLKELEKFGYEELGYGYRKLFIDTMRTSLYIDIWKTTRDIRLRVDSDEKVIDLRNELDYLYDLIETGYVEKVDG